MEVDLFKRTGKMAIGSRLRMLNERIIIDAGSIYKLYGVDIKPKWFSVFYALIDGQAKSVTEIAKEIGQSHPSVIHILKEMKKAKLVREKTDRNDKRRTLVALSVIGKQYVPFLEHQCKDVSEAIEKLSAESAHNLWDAIGEWERLLEEKSLLNRVMEEKERRESDEVQIVYYDDAKHHEAFKSLNVQWISDLFVIEDEDLFEIDHPVENIINKGGYIFIATYQGVPVGTFAMMRCQNPKYDFELVKFAVNPTMQGKRIGHRLIEACLDKARSLGKYRLFIESNHRCEAAVHLYRKYGFKELPEIHSEYERCDIQMELIL